MNFSNISQPVCLSKNLKDKKLLKAYYRGEPIVLVRNKTIVSAYQDFCPHRGAPLSEGILINGQIQCPYHGWRFNCDDGVNTFVPVKNSWTDCKLTSFKVVDKYGLIWVGNSAKSLIPELNEVKPSIALSGEIEANLLNVIENFLEGSHTHYVHNGWVRSEGLKRQKINAQLITNDNGFKVYYDLEKSKGLLTKILPKKLQDLRPVATYIYPNTAILEYCNANNKTIARFEGIVIEKKNVTAYFARVFISLGILSPILSFLAKFLFIKIINQDKKILELQENNLKQFSAIKFISEDTDTVGSQIHAWLYDRNKVAKDNINFIVYW